MSMPGKTTIKAPPANFGRNLESIFHWQGSRNFQRRSGPVMNSFVSTGGRTTASCDRTQARLRQVDFSHQRPLTAGSGRAREILRPVLWSAGKSGAKKILNGGA